MAPCIAGEATLMKYLPGSVFCICTVMCFEIVFFLANLLRLRRDKYSLHFSSMTEAGTEVSEPVVALGFPLCLLRRPLWLGFDVDFLRVSAPPRYAWVFFGCALAALCPAAPAQQAVSSGTPPRVFLLDAKTLAEEKQRLTTAKSTPLSEAIRDAADRAMKAGPFSVMDKGTVPPSGDKHDYMSQAPYFWPDPKKANGLPYVRRDGERNPEIQ